MLSEKVALSLMGRNSVGVFANCRHIYRQLFTIDQAVINGINHTLLLVFRKHEDSVKN